MVKDFEVEYYVKLDGSCPVMEFIDGLTYKMQAKVMKEIELLALNGNELREPHSKYLRDGIFELRITAEGNITRVLYFFVRGKHVVLTNGFVKKTQTTPPRIIEIAIESRKNYLEEKKYLLNPTRI